MWGRCGALGAGRVVRQRRRPAGRVVALSDPPGVRAQDPRQGLRGPAASGWTLALADNKWIPIARGLRLTRRESEIVRCVLDNLDSEAVAARFQISPRTVRAHLEHIYKKLGLRNRCDLVLLIFAASIEHREGEG